MVSGNCLVMESVTYRLLTASVHCTNSVFTQLH